jgi:hypothetical protein
MRPDEISIGSTTLARLRAYKQRLVAKEARLEAQLEGGRLELRRLIHAAIAEEYSKAAIARALGVSDARVHELLRLGDPANQGGMTNAH